MAMSCHRANQSPSTQNSSSLMRNMSLSTTGTSSECFTSDCKSDRGAACNPADNAVL